MRLPRSIIGTASLLLLWTCATGCRGSIVGDWRLEKALPGRQVFSVDDAHFKGDGTFSAVVTRDGRTLTQTGKFDFSGFKLTLLPKEGGQQAFDAVMNLDRSLELSDKDRHCVLVRQ